MITCQYVGHENIEVQGVCLFESCAKNFFFCLECVLKNFHESHQTSHCIDFNKFNKFLETQINYLSETIEQNKKSIEIFQGFIKYVEKQDLHYQVLELFCNKLHKIINKYNKVSGFLEVMKNRISQSQNNSHFIQSNKKYLKWHFGHMQNNQLQLIQQNEQFEKDLRMLTKILIKTRNHIWKNKMVIGSSKYDKALLMIKKIITYQPQDKRALFYIGQILMNQNQFYQAIQTFDQITNIDKFYYGAYFQKGIALSHLQQYEKAIQNFNIELSNSPDFQQIISLLFKKGFALQKIKQFKQAIECYNQIILIDDSDLEAHYCLGIALQNLNEYFLAVQQYEIVLKSQPNDFEAKYNKGLALMELKNYTDAAQCFQDIYQNNPNFVKLPKLMQLLGFALCELGIFDDALEAFNNAIDFDPTNIEILYTIGDNLMQKEQFEYALNYFRKFLKSIPTHLEANLKCGIILYNLRDFSQALEHFNKIACNKYHEEAIYYKGLSLFALKKIELSLKEFNRILEKNQNNLQAHIQKGICLYKLNDYKGAQESFDQIISRDSENQIVQYYMGKSLAKSSFYSEAVQCFHKVLSLNPNHKKAQLECKKFKQLVQKALKDQDIVHFD